MHRRTFALSLAALTATSPFALAQQKPADMVRDMPIPDIIKGVESGSDAFMHPSILYVVAQRLFATEDKKDEAVFWFYAGQLRYRIHLAARPSLDKSGDPALFTSLSETVGKPINLHAFGDLDALLATIDRALAWDATHRDRLTPQEHFGEVRDAIRKGLEDFKADIVKNREQIKAERAKTGLPNK